MNKFLSIKRRENGADYTVNIDKEILCIIDCDSDGARSVTNDAENIIPEIFAIAQPFDAVIYRDSTGNWDEIRVKDGKFVGFKSINQRDVKIALAVIRERVANRNDLVKYGSI